VADDGAGLMRAAADFITARLGKLSRGARLVLAGGSTPRALHGLLVDEPWRTRVAWKQGLYTFSDERCLPPEHPDSNYGMARDTLLTPLGVPRGNVLRFRGEDPPEAAARKVHATLRGWNQQVPLFDLAILGLGNDAHTASLFPAESWPNFGTRFAVATRHPSGQDRVTLTPHALRQSAVLVFLVSGSGKAEALKRTLHAPAPSPEVPARMVAADHTPTHWFVDREAAALL
jgi:6-phosphogluconolactonase